MVSERLTGAFRDNQTSETLASTLITELARDRAIDDAREIFETFFEHKGANAGSRVSLAMSSALLDAGYTDEARRVLDRLPTLLSPSEAFDAARVERRAGRQEQAHRYFEKAGDAVWNDMRALHEFAQTKIKLSGKLYRQRRPDPYRRDARLRLLREARDMLQRVLQMDAPPTRHAWAWYDLGRVLKWSGAPNQDVEEAFRKAREHAPDEPRFQRL